jgi:hypothetical protein
LRLQPSRNVKLIAKEEDAFPEVGLDKREKVRLNRVCRVRYGRVWFDREDFELGYAVYGVTEDPSLELTSSYDDDVFR